MIRPARQTLALAVALGGLVLADVAVHRVGADVDPPLPALPPISPDDVARITLSRGDDRVGIRRDGETWTLEPPVDQPADPQAVDALLAPFADGVRMELRVDDGDHAAYGLTNPDVVRVRLHRHDGDELALHVGATTTGGSSFVRLPGDDTVYRARVGGRARWVRDDLRDPTVLPPGDIDRVQVRIGDGARVLSRHGDGWVLDGTVPVDPDRARAVTDALSGWRARAVLSPDHPAGTRPADGVLTVNGVEVALVRDDDGAYARTGGRILRVDAALVDALLAPDDAWRDRRLLRVSPDAVTRISWEDDDRTVAAARTAAGWQAAPGAHPDDALARLSALRARPHDGPFTPDALLVISHPGGTDVVEIGARDGDRRLVRRVGEVGVVSEGDLAAIRRALAGI